MSILSVHQPHYLPWPGYFAKIDSSDVFVYLDNVQFESNGWQNRNIVKGPNSKQWITVPILHGGSRNICDIKIDGKLWVKKHINTIKTCYGRADYFKNTMNVLNPIYDAFEKFEYYEFLSNVNKKIIFSLYNMLGILDKTILNSSDLSLKSTDPNDRLIEIAKMTGCKTYLAGSGSKAYVDISKFMDNGISVVFQEFNVPSYSYTQQFDNFINDVSILDMIMNIGVIDTMNNIKRWKSI